MDKNGNCPNCDQSWKGDDILQFLANLDVNRFATPRELQNQAALYGYSAQKPRNFTEVDVHQVAHNLSEEPQVGEIFYQCPNCYHCFDAVDETEYATMSDARNGRRYVDILEESNLAEEVVEQEEFEDPADSEYTCGACGGHLDESYYCKECKDYG